LRPDQHRNVAGLLCRFIALALDSHGRPAGGDKQWEETEENNADHASNFSSLNHALASLQ
jgi:hypothetical protein